jgi:hypothetical protein
MLFRMKKLHGASSPSNLEFNGTVIIKVNDGWLDLPDRVSGQYDERQ